MASEPRDYNPIWLSADESLKDFHELVEIVRSELTRTRGKIDDIARKFPGWGERVDFASGGLTCIISALYPGMIEYAKHKQR